MASGPLRIGPSAFLIFRRYPELWVLNGFDECAFADARFHETSA